VPRVRCRRFGGFREHQGERTQPNPVLRAFIELFGAREGRQHVDNVMLGVIVDGYVLLAQRVLHRVAKELA
jgi:hypothetical protein